MSGTKADRDRRRAKRWIARSGGLPWLPADDVDLLVSRLALRRRGRLQAVPFLLVALGVIVSTLFAGAGSARWAETFALRGLAAYALICAAQIMQGRFTARAERRLASALPNRVSRGTAVPIRMMLGPARASFVAVALVLEAALAVAVLSLRSGWLTWTYLAGFLAACGFVAVGMRQAATRGTVALDPLSLTIDERLRSDDAFAATVPLYLLLFAFPAAAVFGHGHDSLGFAWTACWMVVAVMRPWADTRPPWRPVQARGPWVPAAVPSGDGL
jgi:hypothetical protein